MIRRDIIMSTKKNYSTIDISKITAKERISIRYKATQHPMREFEQRVGNSEGISKGSANNAWQEAKRKLGLNSVQLIVLAKTTDLFDKEK